MAVTLNKLVYDILNIAAHGVQPDDFRISERQVALWIHEMRAKLIHQAMQKRGDILDNWLQHIQCLELTQVDASECCDVDSECTVLKSVLELPAYIEIVSVRNTNNSVAYSPVNLFRAKYSSANKYTGNRVKWYMKDNHLYLINSDVIGKVNVSGVFEDPSDLKRFNNCSNTPCYSDDDTYPVNLRMATDITDIILKTKILPTVQMPVDNSNNADATPKNTQE